MTKAKIKVVQDEQKPIEKTVLAKAIIEVSQAMATLSRSGLNRRAIVALIQDKSKIGKYTIEVILNNLEDLAKDYCT